MGLPGSGKTTLANELGTILDAKRLNADEVRKEANDWDFSEEGRSSPVYKGGNFSPVMDQPTHQFHKWVANSLI